jgi:hypothetical protein
VKAPTVVSAEVIMCLARSLADGSVCSTYGMLFVVVAGGGG